eukprot:TRINITY_DN7835_c1_g2_i1.p1 TRINITY_DN7835_c1_g2~~TRINITY_DN7835_c1_g2_i1.p1  ORF type:complete len:268 (+),score=64.71 TRINITY_DN7835_c1_g2_i1:1-804(+)
MGVCMGKSGNRAREPTFKPIPDQFNTFEQVQAALRDAGLEASSLMIGIDYTKSNRWTGAKTFDNKCLHDLNIDILNPYQAVIDSVGRVLSPFDDDGLIPAFGFGDSTTKDRSTFPFFPDGRSCNGFEEVLHRYNEITPNISLSGPTSFAPLIRQAIMIVRETREYHIVVIIADGQVTTPKDTIDAIVEASNYPISIVMVGVGDGPWDTMEEFDDGLPRRKFDNFQFVDYYSVLSKYGGNASAFAVEALQEIPDQYKAIKELGLMGNV